jgi:hypothetical protein
MTDFIIPYEAKLVTRNPEVVLLLLLLCLLAILSLRSIQTRKEILQLLALYFQLLFQNLPSQFSNSSAREFLFQFHQMLTTQYPSEEATTIRAEGMFFPLLLRLIFWYRFQFTSLPGPMGHGMETKFGTICQVFMSALSTNSSTIVVLVPFHKANRVSIVRESKS